MAFLLVSLCFKRWSINPYWSLYSIDMLEITEGYQKLLEIEITRDYLESTRNYQKLLETSRDY